METNLIKIWVKHKQVELEDIGRLGGNDFRHVAVDKEGELYIIYKYSKDYYWLSDRDIRHPCYNSYSQD